MAHVTLTRLWFAPGGARWRPGTYLDFPDALLDFVPSSGRISDGEKMIPANDWREKHGKKREALEPAAFAPNTGVAADQASDLAPDTDVESKSVPANAEGASPASPRSSGPETTALPSDTSKVGEVTSSGTEAEKGEPVKPAKK